VARVDRAFARVWPRSTRLEFGIWLGDAEPAQADAACDMLAALLRESLD
jgi:hypothetical protein